MEHYHWFINLFLPEQLTCGPGVVIYFWFNFFLIECTWNHGRKRRTNVINEISVNSSHLIYWNTQCWKRTIWNCTTIYYSNRNAFLISSGVQVLLSFCFLCKTISSDKHFSQIYFCIMKGEDETMSYVTPKKETMSYKESRCNNSFHMQTQNEE